MFVFMSFPSFINLLIFLCDAQTTWSQNDIKMSSEFQSLICASTAVAFDMIYSYFNIGTEFITLNFTGKRELLYIYLVNLIVLVVAQAIAKYELSRQVVMLKLDITEALNAVTTSYQKKMTVRIDMFRKELKTAVETVTHKRIEKEAQHYEESKTIVDIASKANRRLSVLHTDGVNRNNSVIAVSNNPLWIKPETSDSSAESNSTRMKSNSAYSTENIDDLQDILNVTASLTTKILQSESPRKSGRRASGFMQASFFENDTLSVKVQVVCNLMKFISLLLDLFLFG